MDYIFYALDIKAFLTIVVCRAVKCPKNDVEPAELSAVSEAFQMN